VEQLLQTQDVTPAEALILNVMGSSPLTPTARTLSRASGLPETAPAEPLRVLIVQADDDACQDLVREVRLLGHRCRTARNGVEAEAMHDSDRADVILADWDLDGIGLCRRMRSTGDEKPYTHFIILTRRVDQEALLRATEAGADDVLLLPVDPQALRLRLISARRIIDQSRKLAERNTVLRRQSEASFLAARIDPLTQVANRLRLSEDLGALWARARRYGHHYSAALCDIDWFKAYNDHYGHLEGDHVLVRVAEAIRRGLRLGDGLYRYGGEEFLVLLPEQSIDEACVAMDRVRRSVEKLAIPTVDGVLTISIGVSELSIRDDKVDDWLRRVDTALYLAKEKGRNRVEGEREPCELEGRASIGSARAGAPDR
jgi:two-component system chemotaxis response regulator CheY